MKKILGRDSQAAQSDLVEAQTKLAAQKKKEGKLYGEDGQMAEVEEVSEKPEIKKNKK